MDYICNLKLKVKEMSYQPQEQQLGIPSQKVYMSTQTVERVKKVAETGINTEADTRDE